jgi:Tol biopolymer transport system component
VSAASDGSQANSGSGLPAISADGRYVAFHSSASNLVSGDTNSRTDIFVHDYQTGQTMRVSVSSGGLQANGNSEDPSISADGRYVAFGSSASNLVEGDTNGYGDVFVHDRHTGQTTRASVATSGSQASTRSYAASISADGRYVAFESDANNLVVGDTNNCTDIFVRDRQTGETTRVSVATGGAQGNAASANSFVSADGRYVIFHSHADNLVTGDINEYADIFVRDRQTGQTTRVSLASAGTQANGSSYDGSISADGRCVTFRSYASNLVSGDTNDRADIFVHDRMTGETTRVSVGLWGVQANGYSDGPSISAGGRYVTFFSYASNLVSDDTNIRSDVFVHDRLMNQTSRVSVASNGTQGDANSDYPSISADGRYVAFMSQAGNLVSGDTNGVSDIFVRDREATP